MKFSTTLAASILASLACSSTILPYQSQIPEYMLDNFLALSDIDHDSLALIIEDALLDIGIQPISDLRDIGKASGNGSDSPTNSSSGWMDLDENGRAYGEARDVSHTVGAMTDEERLINGYYVGENPFSSESTFKNFIQNPEYLRQVGTYLNWSTVESIPSSMALRVLKALIEANLLETYQAIVMFMSENFPTHGSEFAELLRTITAPTTDPKYLLPLIEKCDYTMASQIGALLNDSNTRLHQIFFDKCSKYVDKSVGRTLLKTVKNVPESLQSYWMSDDPVDEIISIETINPTGEPGTTVLVQHSDDQNQIAFMFNKSGPLFDLKQVKDTSKLALRCQQLSRSSEMQRRFVSFHLDKISNALTVVKSPNPEGPHVIVFHRNSDGSYEIDQSLLELTAEPLNTKAPLTSRTATISLDHGDIFLGLPEDLSVQSRDLVVASILGKTNLTDVSDIVSAINEIAELNSSNVKHDIIVGLVPLTSDMLQQILMGDFVLSENVHAVNDELADEEDNSGDDITDRILYDLHQNVEDYEVDYDPDQELYLSDNDDDELDYDDYE